MKIVNLISLAMKYFSLHKKRYLFLLIALSFGFGVITILTSIKEGMEENLYNTAQAHYAGDIIIQGDTKSGYTNLFIDNSQNIIDKVRESESGVDKIVVRTQSTKGTLHFNGVAVTQKYIFGVDWQVESDYFSSLEYLVLSDNPYIPRAIMISLPVANELNVQLGDMITLEGYTGTGRINTGSYILTGIINDSSIFGYYKTYLSRVDLNKLIGFNDDQCSSIGLYLSNRDSVDTVADKVYHTLKPMLNMAPQLENRDDLHREKRKSWDGVRYFIMTLPVYLTEVSQLLLAIELVAYFLYVLMLSIIIVSVLVTYRLVLHEREKEIGTMRAIAFSQGEVISLLLFESLILFVISIIVGFIISRLAIWGISFIPLDFMPSIEIFMQNGKITAIYSLRTTLINIGIVFISLLPAVLWPVYNASRQPLAVVLSGGNK